MPCPNDELVNACTDTIAAHCEPDRLCGWMSYGSASHTIPAGFVAAVRLDRRGLRLAIQCPTKEGGPFGPVRSCVWRMPEASARAIINRLRELQRLGHPAASTLEVERVPLPPPYPANLEEGTKARAAWLGNGCPCCGAASSSLYGPPTVCRRCLATGRTRNDPAFT